MRRRARKRGPYRSRAAHAHLLAGFLDGPASAVAVGSARTTGFLNAANNDAYTRRAAPLFAHVPSLFRRRCLPSRFFFTVLYNRQSPVLRGPETGSRKAGLSRL